MRLTFVARGEALEVDVPESAWKHQQSDFCIARTDSARTGFQQVFVKRFRNGVPDAHSLLLGSAHKPLPNVPPLLHCENQDGVYYYVYATLDGYKDLSFYLQSGGDYSRIMGPSSARLLLIQMAETLAEINQRGYYHPDVCWRNIMARFRRDQIPDFALIDVDSCLSLQTSQLPSAVKCDQTWWSLYLYKRFQDPVCLNPTMILSMSLVLCRLFGQLSYGRNGSGAREILLGRPDDQRSLFEVCERSDVNEFTDVFLPAHSQAGPINGILSAWRRILQSMQARRATPWAEIQQFADDLMGLQIDLDETSPEEQSRADLAVKRAAAMYRLRTALRFGEASWVDAIYSENEDLLRVSRSLSAYERERIQQARQDVRLSELRAAIQGGQEREIVQAGERAIHSGCSLDVGEYAAILRARQVLAQWEQFERATSADDDSGILGAYCPSLLEQCSLMTDRHRQRVALARRRIERWPLLQGALASDDDERIAELYEPDVFNSFREFTPGQQQRAELALRRMEAYRRLNQALKMQEPQDILKAYDQGLLGSSTLLKSSQRRRLEHARRESSCRASMEEALRSRDPARILKVQTEADAAGVRLPDELDREAIEITSRHWSNMQLHQAIG